MLAHAIITGVHKIVAGNAETGQIAGRRLEFVRGASIECIALHHCMAHGQKIALPVDVGYAIVQEIKMRHAIERKRTVSIDIGRAPAASALRVAHIVDRAIFDRKAISAICV